MEYILHGSQVEQEFQTRGRELTTPEFWREHLGLKNNRKRVRLPEKWSREAE